MVYIAFLIIGAGAGGALIYFYLQVKLAAKLTEQQLLSNSLEERNTALQKELSQVQDLAKQRESDIKLLQEEKNKFTGEISALTATSEKEKVEISQISELVKVRETEIKRLQAERDQLSVENASLNTAVKEERKASEEKLALLNSAKERLSEHFKTIAHDALVNNNEVFSQIAESKLKTQQTIASSELDLRKQAVENLIGPLKEELEKLKEAEKGKEKALGSLEEKIKTIFDTETKLAQGTETLIKALQTPVVRGSWGEHTLKRVVEMAGLRDKFDYIEQKTYEQQGSDKKLRPDMIVQMPENRYIFIDAKNIFMDYLNSVEEKDEVKRNALLEAHVKAVEIQINKLSEKDYRQCDNKSADFVILFIPNENLYTECLKRRPDILQAAIQKRILITHPMTLLGFLQIVNYTWRQIDIGENAERISEIGKKLLDRLIDFAEHHSKIGNAIKSTVMAYNTSIGTLETSVRAAATELVKSGIKGNKDLKLLKNSEEISVITRDIKKIGFAQTETGINE